jgi:hypothetical protein|tara:strand:+ start:1066 stop:2523 length:1458 start_codon:yes stop_codon:yes gene_type:complete
MSKLILGYDFIGKFGNIPNTFPTDLLEPVFKKKSGDFNHTLGMFNSGAAFDETIDPNRNDEVSNIGHKNFVNWSVYNGTSWLWSRFTERLSVQDIKRKGIKNWVYIIEPFGSLHAFLGLKQRDDDIYEDKFFTKYISNFAKEEIKKGNCKILINYMHEGLVTNDDMRRLHECLDEFNLPHSSLIFVVNDWSAQKRYNKLFNTKNGIKFIYTQYSMVEKSWEFNEILYDRYTYDTNWAGDKISVVTKKDFLDYKDKIRNHHFNCLNRRIRPHRYSLLCRLLENNLIDNNLVSFSFTMDGRPHYDALYQFLRNKKLTDKFYGMYQELLSMSPRVVDYKDFEAISGFRFENKDPYLDSYFNVITESWFTEQSDYLSEKAWRGFGHFQPFIIYGRPNSLKELRRLGYKTFHPYIDESYDTITHPRKRLDAISKEIERLSSMSLEKLHEWYYSMEDILIYNNQKFLEYGTRKNKEKFHENVIEEVKKCWN